ncbi:MAG: hypothetical protein PHF77_01540 [Candidatus Bipolaricaulis anaerobius]|nr:hypothetical protein [Candidatus Bipolaricaulis anaerobius]
MLRNAVARRRGYAEKPDIAATDLEIRLDDLLEPVLPRGFTVQTMDEEDDVERRRELFGRAVVLHGLHKLAALGGDAGTDGIRRSALRGDRVLRARREPPLGQDVGPQLGLI